jgi:hypothetical protein
MNATTSPVTAALGGDVLFSPKAVAARYGVSTQTLAGWRWEKRGPRYVKMAGRVRYRLSDLQEWESTFQRGGGSAAAAA